MSVAMLATHAVRSRTMHRTSLRRRVAIAINPLPLFQPLSSISGSNSVLLVRPRRNATISSFLQEKLQSIHWHISIRAAQRCIQSKRTHACQPCTALQASAESGAVSWSMDSYAAYDARWTTTAQRRSQNRGNEARRSGKIERQ